MLFVVVNEYILCYQSAIRCIIAKLRRYFLFICLFIFFFSLIAQKMCAQFYFARLHRFTITVVVVKKNFFNYFVFFFLFSYKRSFGIIFQDLYSEWHSGSAKRILINDFFFLNVKFFICFLQRTIADGMVACIVCA